MSPRTRRRTTTRRVLGAMLAAGLGVHGGCSSGGDTKPLPTQPSTPCALSRRSVPNEGWEHVPEGTAILYASNPPASGPHYPVWARYKVHTRMIPRGYWVHNLEHGAIVFLYRPDAPAATAATLRETWSALGADPACGHRRALVTADPELTTDIAVVAADVVLEGNCVDPRAIVDFAASRRGRGPEAVCTDGGVE